MTLLSQAVKLLRDLPDDDLASPAVGPLPQPPPVAVLDGRSNKAVKKEAVLDGRSNTAVKKDAVDGSSQLFLVGSKSSPPEAVKLITDSSDEAFALPAVVASPPPVLGGSKLPLVFVWSDKGRQLKRKFPAGEGDINGPAMQKRRVMAASPRDVVNPASSGFHSLELKAYGYALKAVYLSKAPPAKKQMAALMALRRSLHISPEEKRLVMIAIKKDICLKLFGCES